MIIIVIAFTIYYVVLLLIFTIGILLINRRAEAKDFQGITVIVAARNEEQNIVKLIDCIISQNYPDDKYELIVVSDRSTDRTEEIVRNYHLPNINLQSISPGIAGGKKRALAKGIAIAKYNILAFTDADCLPGKNWLREVNNHFTKDIDYLAGYSPLLDKRTGLFSRLKNLERISIFAVSAGSIGWNWGLTCTGRNIAYRKSLYLKVNGFAGIEDIPSGDDDLMLQRMSPYIRKMTYMFSEESFVKSFDNKKFSEQVHQETRRASKWRYYPLSIKLMTGLVFVYYLLLVYLAAGVIFGSIDFSFFLLLILMKVLAEFILITLFLIRIKQLQYLVYFPIAEIVYIPYFIFFALKGSLTKYRWKG